MEDPTTIAMNLTFFGTLAVGLVMFLGVFAAFVLTLLLAGFGRLVATAATALFRRRTPGSADGLGSAAQDRPAAAKAARKEPQISPEWAAAVERADARARDRAAAAAAPDATVSVRELPVSAEGREERKAS
ncbi:MAG TPA: hypothetical protein VFN00_12680 [Arthrobacter sp.]|nr:hypothetical protein [Arthrobacter sp.]